MQKALGQVGVIVCTFGAYSAHGGHLGVLWQPLEFVIIGGSAIAAYATANSKSTLKHTMPEIKAIYKPPRYTKESYLELLSMMFIVFKAARSKGWLSLEQHIENPHESDIFNKFPGFAHDHHAVTFFCDYLRLISLGVDKPHEIEALLDQEIDTQKEDRGHVAHAIQGIADGMPALGIVAAVLGVIHTMGSISEPPEVLGALIGAALVGTFAGVFAAYGFVAPLASAIKDRNDTELKYFICIKTTLLAFLQGAAPQVAIEFGRKILPHDVQPTFAEVEETSQKAAG